MRDTYIIRVSSQKGGVGKTTIAINLATVLRANRYQVLLIDADTSNPSIAAHLGFKDVRTGYRELIETGKDIEKGILVYPLLDIKIIPGTFSEAPFAPTEKMIDTFYKKVYDSSNEIVIVDTPPGPSQLTDLRHFNEALLVTTPDVPSAQGIQVLAKQYEKHRIKQRLAINRAEFDRFELTKEEIEKMYGDIAYALLPEDQIVKRSISSTTPAYLLDSNSQFSKAVEELAHAYSLRMGEPAERGGARPGIMDRIRSLLGLPK